MYAVPLILQGAAAREPGLTTAQRRRLGVVEELVVPPTDYTWLVLALGIGLWIVLAPTARRRDMDWE